jgi:hypothetical protein
LIGLIVSIISAAIDIGKACDATGGIIKEAMG